jgi:uncharacterized protein (TIGR02588 family)
MSAVRTRSATGKDAGPRQSDQEEDRGRSLAEWVGVTMSLAIVLGLVGLILYEHFAGGTGPATIQITPRSEELRREGNLVYLPLEVSNGGDLTAEQVRIRLSVGANGGQRPLPDVLVDFLAGGQTVDVVIVFPDDGSEPRVVVEGITFLDP